MIALALAALTKAFPRAGVVVDALDLRVEPGEFFTFLGPSGCGKSTILRLIAGFEEPTGGRILFDGRDVTAEPPNRRGIGLVFQNYALFPHLSVARNVAFGLEARRLPAADVQRRVAAALERLQLGALGTARVDQLSGGQQQRVALARALAIEPALWLLDEPLSNLDARLREETRAALRALHGAGGVTTINVTHDQSEALGMSDRIAVLNAGRIQQLGTPVEIYERPANRFVARFIGHNNVIDGTVAAVGERAVTVRFATGGELAVDVAHRAPGVELRPGARVGVCVRAESLSFADDGGVFGGVVADIEYGGPTCACTVSTDAGELRVDVASAAARARKGDRVRLAVSPAALHLVGPE